MKRILFSFLVFSISIVNAQVELENGLFMYLNFDGDTIQDLSQNQSQIQVHGKPAVFDDGQNLSSTLSIVDDSSATQVMVQDTIYSASLWVKTDVEVDNNESIWFSAIQFYEYGVPNNGDGSGIWIGPSTTLAADEEVTVALTKNSPNNFPRTMAGDLGLGTEWHHYLINYNGSSYDIYVDGVKQTTYNTPDGNVTLQLADNPVIGVRYQIDGAIRTKNTGKIDEVRMYNRVLNEDEIDYLYTSYTNPLEVGLIAYLDFDDEMIKDESPLENPIIVNGNPASFGVGNGLSSALSIKDDSTAVQIELEDTLYAASIWVATDVEVDNNESLWFSALQFYEYGIVGNADGAGLWVGPSTTLGANEEVTIAVTNNSPNYFPRTMAGNLSLDIEWHHYLMNYNGSSYDIYVDGVKQTTFNAPDGNVMLQHLDNPTIGVRLQSDGEIRTSNTGNIDEVRLYNRALSANEIGYLYEEGDFEFITGATVIGKESVSTLYPTIFSNENQLNSSEEISSVSVLSIEGRELASATSLETINYDTLPKGLLVVRAVLEDGRVVVQKVMKK